MLMFEKDYAKRNHFIRLLGIVDKEWKNSAINNLCVHTLVSRKNFKKLNCMVFEKIIATHVPLFRSNNFKNVDLMLGILNCTIFHVL